MMTVTEIPQRSVKDYAHRFRVQEVKWHKLEYFFSDLLKQALALQRLMAATGEAAELGRTNQ